MRIKKKVKVIVGEHGTAKHNANTAQRKAVRRPTFSAGWFVVMVRIGDLSEELRVLRQTEGVSAGEKKAIGAMLDKIGKFNDYVANCLIMEGVRSETVE